MVTTVARRRKSLRRALHAVAKRTPGFTGADLANVLNTVAATGADLTGWIASPALHANLITATDAMGRQFFINDPAGQRAVGSVFGAPVYRTRGAMAENTVGFAGDFQGSAVYGTVEGIQISISDQATLTDGATQLNLWQRNMFAVRAEIEVGFRVRDEDHFVQINDGTPIA